MQCKYPEEGLSAPEAFLYLFREKANIIGPKTVRSMLKAQNEA